MKCLKYIFFAITAVVLLAPMVSCKKLLEQDPINSPYNEVFWKDEKDALQGLAGGYALLRKALTVNTAFGGNMSHFSYGDLTAFEFDRFNQYDLDFLITGGKGFNNASFIGDYLEDYHDWSPHFRVITQANIILHHVAKIPDNKFTHEPVQTRNKILGEALFLRAFSYFYMVRLWGDVPLVTTYDEDPAHAQNVARTSEKTVLDTCINDLQQAISLLPWDYLDGAEKAVRANKGAAYALLAHVYMWKDFLNKGVDNQNLTKAIAAVDAIQQSHKYRLVDSTEFVKLFKGKSDEGIFEINMQVGQSEQQTQSGFYYKCLMQPYIKGKTSQNGVLKKELIDDLYEGRNDYRYYYNFAFTSDNTSILTKYAGLNAENVFYKDLATYSLAAVDANIILFRYADVLLLRAEANAKLGQYGAARTDLEAVSTRAGASPYEGDNEGLYEEIFRERSRELFCEGQRWYDLVRTGFLKTEAGGTFGDTRYNQEGWKWPVARKLFVNNYVLRQNRFWEGKVK